MPTGSDLRSPDDHPGDGRPPPVRVDGFDDPRLTEYRDLNDPARRRRLESERAIVVVEGRVAVRRMLDSTLAVRSMLVDDHQVTLAADLVAAVRDRGAPVYVVPRHHMAAVVGFRLHRGIVAVATRPPPADAAPVLAGVVRPSGAGTGPPIVVVLEGLNDPENIGAVFRNAAAFGAGAVLLDPTCGDPWSRRAVRVSVGHSLHLPFARLAPWPAALGRVREAGFAVCAMAPRPGPGPGVRPPAVALRTLAERRTPVALVLGAEGPGLSDGALAAADAVVSVPMAPGVDSLNVATAAAVALAVLSGA